MSDITRGCTMSKCDETEFTFTDYSDAKHKYRQFKGIKCGHHWLEKWEVNDISVEPIVEEKPVPTETQDYKNKAQSLTKTKQHKLSESPAKFNGKPLRELMAGQIVKLPRNPIFNSDGTINELLETETQIRVKKVDEAGKIIDAEIWAVAMVVKGS